MSREKNQENKKDSRAWNRKRCFFAHPFLMAAAGFCLYLPYFLAFWPGVLTPDSIWQMRQAMHLTNYQNQHPFLHTLIIEFCYRVGSTAAAWIHQLSGGRLCVHTSDTSGLLQAADSAAEAAGVTGRPEFADYGVALYSLVSMAWLSLCLSGVIFLLYRNLICGERREKASGNEAEVYRPGIWMVLLSLLWLFFFCFPYIAVTSITMWKDVPFSAAVVLFVVMVWDHEHRRNVWSFREHLLFVILSIFVCTLRSNGLIAWCIFLFGFILVYRNALFNSGASLTGKAPRRMLRDCLLALVITILFLGPVQHARHVEPADLSEALSIPLQQVACTITRNEEEGGGRLTGEEMDELDRIFDVTSVPDSYESRISDPVKALVVERGGSDVIRQDPLHWAGLYFKIGFRNPDCYAAAYYGQTSGYYVPTAGTVTDYSSEIQENTIGLYRVYLLPYAAVIGVYNLLNICRKIYSALWCNAFTVYVIFAALAVMKFRKHGKTRKFWKIQSGHEKSQVDHPEICLLLPIGIWITVLLSTPVNNDFRYVFALFLCMLPAVLMAAEQ